jgi:crossover junction endodeoxyribonuclease RuvC
MIILGIDPGSITLGYGVIEKQGNKLTHLENGAVYMKKEPLSVKLEMIYNQINDVINQYKPEVMSIENIFYAKNIQSTIKLAHARSIPILLAKQKNIPIFQFSPLEVKKSVTGYGRADKSQMQDMIRILLKLPEIADPDASDALALAMTYAHLPNFERDKYRV